ncbi:MarR family winged helix-turn-helix transcriptional regulator [Levilactobacillus yonginensis]|uniref:MarR family winged helix-turn-helix transcriptional regulator n=1 Tax=Levilactobacillus yonginensis TaxID=1054041 RepID=UPI000F794378|nr:MarR family transcriptional regulator [Levilactobacillus yonginensis]
MESEGLVTWKLVLLGRKIRHKRNLFVRQLDLTSEQADALRFFEDHPQHTISDFKDQQQITHQTARLIVKRLVDRGLLVLDPNPNDGRAKLVGFTAAGLAKCQQLDDHIKATSQESFVGFSQVEQQALLKMLARIDQNLERS